MKNFIIIKYYFVIKNYNNKELKYNYKVDILEINILIQTVKKIYNKYMIGDIKYQYMIIKDQIYFQIMLKINNKRKDYKKY